MLTRRFGALAILALTIGCGAGFAVPSAAYGVGNSPATISAQFAAPSILVIQAVALEVTVGDPASTPAFTNVGFTGTLPAGLTVSDGSATICGGTLTRTAATSQIVLTGASMAAGASCQFNAMVTGAAAGAYTVATSGASSTQAITGLGTTASLHVDAPATIAAAFTPSSVAPGATTQLQFTITDPAGNPDDLKFLDLADTLPAGLTVASAGPTTTCVGTLTVTAPSTITLSAATIPMSGPCVFSVTVTATAAGSYTNTATGLLGGFPFTGSTVITTLGVVSPTPSPTPVPTAAPTTAPTAPPTSASDAGTSSGIPAQMPLLLVLIAGLAAAALTMRLAARSGC